MEKIRLEHIDGNEYFQGKDKGDIYIKIPKERDITLEVEALSNIKIQSLNELRDEYHSIGELYEFRKAYNALLFNEWAKTAIGFPEGYTPISIEEYVKDLHFLGNPRVMYDVHKSWRHNDGELAFGGGWFIVSAMLPTGLITNHYKEEDWDLFQIPEVEKAKYEYDGHTPADSLDRMLKLLKQ